MDKTQFLDFLTHFVQSKIDFLQQEISDIQRDNASDTKSTAGDKHETGRAMMHLEIEKLAHQVGEYQQQLQTIHHFKHLSTTVNCISNGTLVQLSTGWFFLGVALGKVTFENTPVFCLSQQAPMGQQLLGKKVGEDIKVNVSTLRIVNIY